MSGDAKKKDRLLLGPLAKIERAKHHINDLRAKVDEYAATNPFRLRVQQKNDPPRRIVFVRDDPPIPPNLCLILGDAVGNIRAALDHLCFAMVQGETPEKGRKQIGFPFARDADDLAKRIKEKKMMTAPEAVIAEFHRLKPYPDGDKYLHAIQELNNTDKHKAILLVGLGIELPFSELKKLIHPAGVPLSLDDERRVSTIGGFYVLLDGVVPAFEKDADFQPSFLLGFGQGTSLENEPLIHALTEMVTSAEGAVRSLAKAFFT